MTKDYHGKHQKCIYLYLYLRIFSIFNACFHPCAILFMWDVLVVYDLTLPNFNQDRYIRALVIESENGFYQSVRRWLGRFNKFLLPNFSCQKKMKFKYHLLIGSLHFQLTKKGPVEESDLSATEASTVQWWIDLVVNMSEDEVMKCKK